MTVFLRNTLEKLCKNESSLSILNSSLQSIIRFWEVLPGSAQFLALEITSSECSTKLDGSMQGIRSWVCLRPSELVSSQVTITSPGNGSWNARPLLGQGMYLWCLIATNPDKEILKAVNMLTGVVDYGFIIVVGFLHLVREEYMENSRHSWGCFSALLYTVTTLN